MYQEFLDSNRTGHDERAAAVSHKPDPPPADTSDRLPTGEELLEMEPEESRAAAFRREFHKPEILGDIYDTMEHDANGIQQFFERPRQEATQRPPDQHRT
jgi:hypothetical protein